MSVASFSVNWARGVLEFWCKVQVVHEDGHHDGPEAGLLVSELSERRVLLENCGDACVDVSSFPRFVCEDVETVVLFRIFSCQSLSEVFVIQSFGGRVLEMG